MNILEKVLCLFRPGSKPSLPLELMEAVKNQDFQSLLGPFRTWVTNERDTQGKSELFALARASGWSAVDLEKLDIYFDFYSGEMLSAFEKARPFCSKDKIDVDLYLLSLAILYQKEQFEDAYTYLSIIPSDSQFLSVRMDYWLIRQLICWSLGKQSETLAALEKMSEIDPDNISLLENSLPVYIEFGDISKVEKILEVLEGSEAKLGYNYAISLLSLGDYERGFAQLEKRYAMDEAQRYINPALFSCERWKGQKIEGKTLLVSAEQGLGDTIQMARYLSMLVVSTGAAIAMETQPESLSLLESNFPRVRFFAREYGKLPPVAFDYWIGAFSLPAIFLTNQESIPERDGYLTVSEDSKHYWKERLASVSSGHKPKIGLVWSGQPRHRADRRRSVPFELLERFLGEFDVDFYALQINGLACARGKLFSFSDEMLTLADTAALCGEMDLVITVDTSVAHLAGGLGKKTWLMLPHRYEWRWGLTGDTCPWYKSIRVFRQERVGNWQTVLNQVFDIELKNYIKHWRSI